jgi:hypothetical protein
VQNLSTRYAYFTVQPENDWKFSISLLKFFTFIFLFFKNKMINFKWFIQSNKLHRQKKIITRSTMLNIIRFPSTTYLCFNDWGSIAHAIRSYLNLDFIFNEGVLKTVSINIINACGMQIQSRAASIAFSWW